ncbi:MAG: Crp/Fnr family transcriptional regulator [Prevotella sp.]|nr:Crp/Fnr family transcriptional regulator [Prevotella sp.]
MDKNNLHERLLELPLFQGMSRNDLEQVLMNTKFRYLTFQRGKTIVNEGEMCDRFFFLMEGVISSTKNADDNGYCVVEKLSAPDILQPERIFGLVQRYTRTFKTMTECNFICLGKMEMLTLADSYQIFRLNLLNIISTRSQRLTNIPWRTRPRSIRQKIIRFIEERCLRPAGDKTVSIKMERLGHEIGESRLNVSHELNAMHEEGIIELRRSEIHVPALEKLINPAYL